MSLKSNAQLLLIEAPTDQAQSSDQAMSDEGKSMPLLEIVDMLQPEHEHEHESMHEAPEIEIETGPEVEHEEHEEHEHHEHEEHEHGHDHDDTIEVMGPDVEFVVDELPGAPPGTLDPEPAKEPVLEVEEQPAADTESSKSKKNEKWDWESKGPTGFVVWVKERLGDTPKHSGYDSAGLERACAYLEKLDNEISKAMRLDLDGELDANKIEEVRAKIDEGISRLQARLDKVKKTKKSNRKKKAEFNADGTIVKEAQKITGVKGVFVTTDLLTSGIARVCINGVVSAGHDIEDLFTRQVEKFKLNTREQAQVMWLLADMGYPLRRDRGFMPDDDFDPSGTEGMDWAQNFKG